MERERRREKELVFLSFFLLLPPETSRRVSSLKFDALFRRTKTPATANSSRRRVQGTFNKYARPRPSWKELLLSCFLAHASLSVLSDRRAVST